MPCQCVYGFARGVADVEKMHQRPDMDVGVGGTGDEEGCAGGEEEGGDLLEVGLGGGDEAARGELPDVDAAGGGAEGEEGGAGGGGDDGGALGEGDGGFKSAFGERVDVDHSFVGLPGEDVCAGFRETVRGGL